MERRKMLRLCDTLTNSNAVWENEAHGRQDNPGRREVVERWMWCALMHLDALGYDVVKQTKRDRFPKG
jgi:hypothetical protein